MQPCKGGAGCGLDVFGRGEMKTKLKMVGFDPALCDSLFTCLAAMLNLGNTVFEPHPDGQKQQTAAQSRLSQVPLAKLETVLTRRSITSGRGSTYQINLSAEQCEEARDALSKARIYR
ncbi:MAG: hypothetical protein SGPRY_013257, partial [Prymnesium sp.]